MGEDAITGVVNSFGQVFRGQSGRNVYENLYVIDDSIIPSPLGVNRQCFIHKSPNSHFLWYNNLSKQYQ